MAALTPFRNTYIGFTQKVYTSRAKLIYLSLETYIPFALCGSYDYSANRAAVVWEPIRAIQSQSEPTGVDRNQSEQTESIRTNQNQSEAIGSNPS